MLVVGKEQSSASVSLTEAELLVLNNSLNEVLNGINIIEFNIRMGASREEARDLLNQIWALLDTMKQEG